MMNLRNGIWLLVGSLVFTGMGCGKIWHNLQPHRLHRLNRVPDYMDDSAYNFSIPDPAIPADERSAVSAASQFSAAPASCSSNICAE